MEKIRKYPRTPHIQGSKLQSGDEDLSQIPFSQIKGRRIVVEEKIDGANSGISFSSDGKLLLQSRGHYLQGGYRERHYNLLKTWATIHTSELYSVLGNRYIMYGEWMYAKHKIYYDTLPSYFIEFDIYDKHNDVFLDTSSRHNLIKDLNIPSVPLLKIGAFNSLEELTSLIQNSLYKSDKCNENLQETISILGLNGEEILSQTDTSSLMEGLYIKIEEDGKVVDRMKFVRYSFTQPESVTNWLDKPIIPNKLAKDKKFI